MTCLAALALVCLTSSLSAGKDLANAAITGDLREVRACVAAGARVNERDSYGWTPLQWAVFYRKIPVARFLLAKGADPNLTTTNVYSRIPVGSTALVIAAYYGLEEETAILLAAGAKVDPVNNANKTAMTYANEFAFQDVADLLSGKRVLEVRDRPDFGPEVTTEPLDQPYSSIALDFISATQDLVKAHPTIETHLSQPLAKKLAGYQPIPGSRAPGGKPATLHVEIELTEFTPPGPASAAGIKSAPGKVHATIKLVDYERHKVVREQRLASESSAWMDDATVSGTEQELATNMGQFITSYVFSMVDLKPEA
jgi:hypothetical protein